MMYKILDNTCPFRERLFVPGFVLQRKAEWKTNGIDTDGYADDRITFEVHSLAKALYVKGTFAGLLLCDHTAEEHRIRQCHHLRNGLSGRHRFHGCDLGLECGLKLSSRSRPFHLHIRRPHEDHPTLSAPIPSRLPKVASYRYLSRGKSRNVSWCGALRTSVAAIERNYLFDPLIGVSERPER